MADVTELRGWPLCVDAIHWSPEGIIALASDETVELLFPNTVSFDGDQDSAQWQHIPLQVPWFSDVELPLKEPARLFDYSIGEEISTSAPIAVGWSPPGLARYRRCALGVLTANLVLSIWAADGKPQLNSNWKRTLVVNHALGDYFHNAAVDAGYTEDDLDEKLRIRKRIRMFAWAPPLPSGAQNYSLGSRLSYGQHMVAMSNDDNQVAIAVITSPASTYGDEQCWNAKVLTHFALESVTEQTCSRPKSLSQLLGQQKSISKIAWSPWVTHRKSSRSVIVYATNEDVRARVLILSHATIQYGDEVIYPGIEMRYSGLMKWSPVADQQDRLTLALFESKGLICLRISIDDASIVERMSHDLDGRWDQITGAIWDTGQSPSPHLHFSSLLSTINNTTSSLRVTHSGLNTLENPSWRDQIENSIALFSVRNDLRGNSKVKVWGLAAAPLQNFVATCSSVHPSNMVEYGSPSDRRSTIAVSALRKYSQMRKDFPTVDVSAEGILFTLKKLVENAIEKADDILPFSREMVEKLMLTYPTVDSTSELVESIQSWSGSAILEKLVLNFKIRAVFNSHTLRDRFTILVSLACDTAMSTTLAKTLIAYRLATVSQEMCQMLPHTAFSAEILQHYKQATSLVSSVMGLKPPSALGDKASLDNGGSAVNASLQTASPAFCSDIAIKTTDTCDFCAAPIPFTDLFSAACSEGHKFPRCGLSMLAIQAPGTTKYCGICNTPFLSEEFVKLQESYESTGSASVKVSTAVEDNADGELGESDGGFHGVGQTVDMQRDSIGWTSRRDDVSPNDESSQTDPERLPVSLARLLFLACDTCIYCGGHFV